MIACCQLMAIRGIAANLGEVVANPALG